MHIEAIKRENRMQTIPCFLAIGCGIREVVDGLNLRGGGTTLACPEWCGGLSWEDAVCSFCLGLRTVKEYRL